MMHLATIVADMVADGGRFGAGETRRTNHPDCGDRRSRLYITFREDGAGGVHLGYCHNCGEPGHLRSGHASMRTAPRATSAPAGTVVPPGTLAPLDGTAPAEGYNWAVGALRLDGMGCKPLHAGLEWDTHTCRVYMPIHDTQIVAPAGGVLSEGELLGYQLRRVFDYGPKYLTVSGRHPLWTRFLPAMPHGDASGLPFVLVEDWASAYAIARSGAGIGVPLFRSMTTAEHIMALKKQGHTKAVIWLDNDNPEVNANAGTLARITRAVGIPTAHVFMAEEPKTMPDAKVAHIVENMAYPNARSAA
jgi:hypothetical protein